MSSLMRWSPYSSGMSLWPTIWEDDDFLSLSNTNNNLDLYETEDEVVVKANVAGVPADKVEVMFEKGVLRIKAAVEEETSDKKKQHYAKSSWSYSYRVAIPTSIMIDYNHEPSAEVENGVMTVTFKKAAASKPKAIKVQSKA